MTQCRAIGRQVLGVYPPLGRGRDRGTGWEGEGIGGRGRDRGTGTGWEGKGVRGGKGKG